MRKYKYLATVLICGLLAVSGSAFAASDAKPSGNINWLTYEEGLAAGKKEGKKIFINFYATWCGYCKLMDKKTFLNPDVKALMEENFVLVKVDTDKEPGVSMKYSVRGLPANWILESNGDKIGKLRDGYLSSEELIPYLKFIYTDSYKKMTFKAFSDAEKK